CSSAQEPLRAIPSCAKNQPKADTPIVAPRRCSAWTASGQSEGAGSDVVPVETWPPRGHASAMDPLPPPRAFFLMLFSGWVNRHQQAMSDYLLEENRILRRPTVRDDCARPMTSDADSP